MPLDMDSLSGSPVNSLMSMSSASTPGTPGSGHFQFGNSSASTGCDMSDSMDSDLENNNVLRNVSSANSMLNVNVKLEPTDSDHTQSTPKKKRYSKSRVRNRSPALVQKLKLTRRSKANDRERSRMHGLNDALDGLRKILPNSGDENKLTKIETLRFAHNYIFALKEMLNMLENEDVVEGDDHVFNAQLSAAMKLDSPTASQTLSHLHQQQLQRRQHQHQHQQQVPQHPPVSPVTVQQQQHHQQQHGLHHPPVSPITVQQHQQQFSPRMQLPHVPNAITGDVMSRRCQEAPPMSSAGTTCYTTGDNSVIQVHNFVSHSPVSSPAFNVATSTSPAGHVAGYRLCPPQFHWTGSLHTSHGFQFEHPHSPTGYSDTSDGYTFEMM